jgi:hypothetical protein
MMTMTISKEVLDELLSGVENADDLLGNQGLMKELKVRLMERMLGAELTEHLGYEPETQPADYQSNRRNGTTRKTLKGNDGALPIDVPRDRDGSFEPELIKMATYCSENMHMVRLLCRSATNLNPPSSTFCVFAILWACQTRSTTPPVPSALKYSGNCAPEGPSKAYP